MATDAPPPGVVLAGRAGPFPGRIDGELLRRWAAATGDPATAVRSGTAVPPVALVTQIWSAQATAFTELVPEAVRASMAGGVHGEHDIVVHRPVRPGEALRTWVAGHGARRAGDHLLATLAYATFDAQERLVAEQWWTTVLLGARGGAAGAPAPDHTFPDGARQRPVGTWRTGLDPELPRRYAGVSGDWSPHHFEAEAARRSGADRPFLHGLCTLALCAQGLVTLVTDGDPTRVRRVAVRFASPAFPGDELVVRAFEAGDGAVAFEAEAGGTAVIRHGRLELRREPGGSPAGRRPARARDHT